VVFISFFLKADEKFWSAGWWTNSFTTLLFCTYVDLRCQVASYREEGRQAEMKKEVFS